MPAKKYIVRLSRAERQQLTDQIKSTRLAAYKRQRAQILLMADMGSDGAGLKDQEIARLLEVGCRTVERTRKRLVELGLEKALLRVPRRREGARILDGEPEAHLVALSCSEAPDGFNRWSLKLLANKMVELQCVESVSSETVRRVLKKRHQTLAA